jgi:hypothetical protein
VRAHDFAGLRVLEEALGDRFVEESCSTTVAPPFLSASAAPPIEALWE